MSHRSESPIVFIHLPRTAGSSMGRAIEQAYGDRALRLKTLAPITEDVVARVGSHIQIIYGHMPHGLHRFMPVRYVTVLREPIERSLSHFRLYQLQMQQKFGAKTPPTFEEFLDHHLAGNVQTRLLAGIGHPDSTPADAVAAAKRNLEDFEAVGFFDDIDGLARRIGIQTPIAHINHIAPRYSATEAELKQLTTLNDQDIPLYRWALTRFQVSSP